MKNINLLEITWDPSWGLWPSGSNTDHSKVSSQVTRSIYGGYTVSRTFYPAYAPYMNSGVLELPKGMRAGGVHNLRKPKQAVIDQQISDLTDLAKRHDVLLWRHAYQCYEETAQAVQDLFKLRILYFGDDCPGSSECKTFPIAKYFNALVHNMWTWDYETGALVVDKYREHGLNDCRFWPIGPSSNIQQFIRGPSFSIKDKVDAIASIPDSLSFVGCAGGMNPSRYQFSRQLNQRAGELEANGMKVSLHGVDMRDGPIGDFSSLYAESLFGHNFAVSSIFNCRLFDLWLVGVVQCIHDPHDELRHFGFLPGVHYLKFDGTVDDLFGVVRVWRHRRLDLTRIAAEAHAQTTKFLSDHSWASVAGKLFEDYLG